MVGLGRNRVVRVPVDGQGRMRADALPHLNDRTILCLQAGNVNTGAFDPAGAICPEARAAGAWIHVDGAFGPVGGCFAGSTATWCMDSKLADSWATDAHKWPNIGYDCGIALVREPAALKSAMSIQAAYLMQGEQREPSHYNPELSRRARGVELWAGLRSLGVSGDGGDRGAHLQSRAAFCRGPPRGRLPGFERRGHQPGAGFVRQRGTNLAHRGAAAGGGNLLVRIDCLAGAYRHAHQRILVGDHRGRRRRSLQAMLKAAAE